MDGSGLLDGVYTIRDVIQEMEIIERIHGNE